MKPGDTRARILEAARDCFARSGYAATTNQHIADLAGITAAAIYQYFDSKTALFMATVRQAKAEMLPLYREAVERSRTARAALKGLLVASAELHERDPSLAAFLSALPVEMRRHEELAQAMAREGSEVVQIFDAVIRVGVRSGEITRQAAPRVLAMFVACTMGFSLYAAAVDGSQLCGIVETFTALMDGKLLRPPRSAS
jgi:AcrR family transcriptional regulator